MKNAQRLGYQGELYVTRALNMRGITSQQLPIGYSYDICADGTKIEVKTSRRNKDGKYNFTLFKKYKANHIHTDIVVFICVLPNGKLVIYVIPTYALLTINKLSFRNPENYSGKYAQYRVQ